jgi:transcriptional regulator with XRE-family HTH domain
MPERTERGLVLPYLRAWRFHRVLSQMDLAERSGVSKPTIARAEAGERISFANIHKLASGLGISAQQLRYEEPRTTAPTSSGGAPSDNEQTS